MNPPPANASPRILCIGMPVRDLTFRVQSMPAHGSKKSASHFAEICGGNALNAAIGIVRLGGRATLKNVSTLTTSFLAGTRGPRGTIWLDQSGGLRPPR
jgi:hypothetical protein